MLTVCRTQSQPSTACDNQDQATGAQSNSSPELGIVVSSPYLSLLVIPLSMLRDLYLLTKTIFSLYPRLSKCYPHACTAKEARSSWDCSLLALRPIQVTFRDRRPMSRDRRSMYRDRRFLYPRLPVQDTRVIKFQVSKDRDNDNSSAFRRYSTSATAPLHLICAHFLSWCCTDL